MFRHVGTTRNAELDVVVCEALEYRESAEVLGKTKLQCGPTEDLDWGWALRKSS